MLGVGRRALESSNICYITSTEFSIDASTVLERDGERKVRLRARQLEALISFSMQASSRVSSFTRHLLIVPKMEVRWKDTLLILDLIETIT